jgi:hypothetical protein
MLILAVRITVTLYNRVVRRYGDGLLTYQYWRRGLPAVWMHLITSACSSDLHVFTTQQRLRRSVYCGRVYTVRNPISQLMSCSAYTPQIFEIRLFCSFRITSRLHTITNNRFRNEIDNIGNPLLYLLFSQPILWFRHVSIDLDLRCRIRPLQSLESYQDIFRTFLTRHLKSKSIEIWRNHNTCHWQPFVIFILSSTFK